jgi:hypothetical protein
VVPCLSSKSKRVVSSVGPTAASGVLPASLGIFWWAGPSRRSLQGANRLQTYREVGERLDGRRDNRRPAQCCGEPFQIGRKEVIKKKGLTKKVWNKLTHRRCWLALTSVMFRLSPSPSKVQTSTSSPTTPNPTSGPEG